MFNMYYSKIFFYSIKWSIHYKNVLQKTAKYIEWKPAAMSIVTSADEWDIVDTDNKQNGKNKSMFIIMMI